MTAVDQAELDRRFRAYYDAEAAAGSRSELRPLRLELNDRFRSLLAAERRSSVLDVGSGPGLDLERFEAAGLGVIGLDLAPRNIRALVDRGWPGVAGSIYDLPIADGSCESVWTMSTLVHVPDARLQTALAEVRRVAAPGAPIGIGTWGGRDWEGVSDVTRFDPPRFFALRSHERWRELLAGVGTVEHYDTDCPPDTDGWEYQFAIVRV